MRETLQVRTRPRRPAAKVGKRARQPNVVPALLPAADAGSGHAQLHDLQQLLGNRSVVRLLAVHAGNGGTPNIRLHGETSGNFDGGTSQVLNRRVVRATGCDCPAEDPCLRATGTLAVTYHVDVTIVMPEMPSGLNECQQGRVRDFLRRVLGPHEQEHARRLRTYNGTSRQQFSVTGCGRAGLESELGSTLQQLHDDDAADRADKADKLSLAIDPFERDIDLDC